eukprot:595757-Prorocentrum_minimum.AAC.1
MNRTAVWCGLYPHKPIVLRYGAVAAAERTIKDKQEQRDKVAEKTRSCVEQQRTLKITERAVAEAQVRALSSWLSIGSRSGYMLSPLGSRLAPAP